MSFFGRANWTFRSRLVSRFEPRERERESERSVQRTFANWYCIRRMRQGDIDHNHRITCFIVRASASSLDIATTRCVFYSYRQGVWKVMSKFSQPQASPSSAGSFWPILICRVQTKGQLGPFVWILKEIAPYKFSQKLQARKVSGSQRPTVMTIQEKSHQQSRNKRNRFSNIISVAEELRKPWHGDKEHRLVWANIIGRPSFHGDLKNS